MDLLAAARSVLNSEGVHKPIWNTEINYGLQIGGGGTAPRSPRGRQAAYVARTYVLNAANGVKRVFWYSWDLQTLANTQLTYASGSLTPAGTTYGVVRGWLLGSKISSCSKDRKRHLPLRREVLGRGPAHLLEPDQERVDQDARDDHQLGQPERCVDEDRLQQVALGRLRAEDGPLAQVGT